MKRKLSFILGCLLLLFVVFFPQIRLGTVTALFLRDILDEKTVHEPDHGALAWVTPVPVAERVQISTGDEQIPADLYRVPDGKRRAAILLTHGIIEAGKDDPRLIRFARSLARSGFVVLVPELKGMKSFRILFSDVDDIVASFLYLASRKEIVDESKMGLLGFSYGAGPTFMAAGHPSLRHQVKFLVSFGGYYDPINVIRFITTGHYEYRDEKGFLKPEPYGKWVFFMNNVDYVQNERDRRLLREIFTKEEEKKKNEIFPLVSRLTPAGRKLYELLTNEDPRRVDDLMQSVDPRVREYLEKLSLAPVLPSIGAYLLIGHGSTDPLIPYTESLRLADAVQDQSRVHVAILKLFTHVDPARKSFSPKEFLTVYLPSMVKFYYLIYDLLSQQR
ncbi:MAG: alpha/beta hydrolase [Deltaproteobacteria bacterium]|nr:alpha/beta hydrolase [Deltaproteobacteria bacterium]